MTTMNFDALFQLLAGSAIIGLFGWVFNLQGRIATFVTREDLSRFQKDVHDNFGKVLDEMKKLAEDLAYLRGKSGN